MADRFHSRVFAAISAIADDLVGATWAPHPVTNLRPTVGVGDSRFPEPNESEVGEFVDVLYRVEDDASVEWGRIQGRDESFLVDVFIRSSVAGTDRPTVWARLEQLAGVPQGLYYQLAPTGPATFVPPEFPGVARLGGLVRVTPQVWRTDQGWVGDCIVTFRVHARI